MEDRLLVLSFRAYFRAIHSTSVLISVIGGSILNFGVNHGFYLNSCAYGVMLGIGEGVDVGIGVGFVIGIDTGSASIGRLEHPA